MSVFSTSNADATAQSELVKQAVADAQATGTHGVYVTRNWLTGELVAEVTELVPFGAIHFVTDKR